jgi:hypothetical protein
LRRYLLRSLSPNPKPPHAEAVDLEEMSAEIGRLRDRLGVVEQTATMRVKTLNFEAHGDDDP